MRSNIAVLPQRRENRILKRGDIYYVDLQLYNSYWGKRLVDDWMEEMIWVD